jgi:hypothetical protein
MAKRNSKPVIKSTKAWASLWWVGRSGDQHEEICEVSFYKDKLQPNLRKIRVVINLVAR